LVSEAFLILSFVPSVHSLKSFLNPPALFDAHFSSIKYFARSLDYSTIPTDLSLDTAADDSSSTLITPSVIAGIALAGAVLTGIGLWLCIHANRNRSHKQRQEKMRAALRSIRRVILESDEKALPPRQIQLL
jgi:hypothetical protein